MKTDVILGENIVEIIGGNLTVAQINNGSGKLNLEHGNTVRGKVYQTYMTAHGIETIDNGFYIKSKASSITLKSEASEIYLDKDSINVKGNTNFKNKATFKDYASFEGKLFSNSIYTPDLGVQTVRVGNDNSLTTHREKFIVIEQGSITVHNIKNDATPTPLPNPDTPIGAERPTFYVEYFSLDLVKEILQLREEVKQLQGRVKTLESQ